jgi:hypothetical protein
MNAQRVEVTTMTAQDKTITHVVVIERVAPVGDFSWINARQAAHHTSVSVTTIRRACVRHELRHIRIGRINGRILTRTEWVDAWMMRGAEVPVVGL